jgi:hypothetical protein
MCNNKRCRGWLLMASRLLQVDGEGKAFAVDGAAEWNQ